MKKEDKKNDLINYPQHYLQYDFKPIHNSKTIEPIDICRAVSKKIEDPWIAHLVCSVLGYVLRFPFKNGIQDLKKAKWFLNKIISEMEGDLR